MISEELLSYPPKPLPCVAPGEFLFAAIGLSHGHIYAICEGLQSAGATLVAVYEKDKALLSAFLQRFPGVRVAEDEEEILTDKSIRVVASADIPSERAPLGIRVMEHGKDFLVDKAPFITLEQAAAVRAAVARTGQKYAVFYSERCGNEAAVYAEHLIQRGLIGRVVHISGAGPHKIAGTDRKEWFYKRATQGGILIDIGSHQVEQFLTYTGAKSAVVSGARIANYTLPEHPEFDDFGDCSLTGDNGTTGYFRTDWLVPASFPTFGDGRTVIVGTEGYIELRKYIDPAVGGGNVVILSNKDGTERREVSGMIGLPFFSAFVRDCLDRTENAMTQEHAILSTEIAIRAQMNAMDLSARG